MTVARFARICAHGFKKASSQYSVRKPGGLLGNKLFSECWGRVIQEAS